MKLILFKEDILMYWIALGLFLLGMAVVTFAPFLNYPIYIGYFIMFVANFVVVVQEARKNNLSMAIAIMVLGKFTYFIWPFILCGKRIYDRKIYVRDAKQNKKNYLLGLSLFILFFTIPIVFKTLVTGFASPQQDAIFWQNILAGIYISTIPATIVAIGMAKEKGPLVLLDIFLGVITMCFYTAGIALYELFFKQMRGK